MRVAVCWFSTFVGRLGAGKEKEGRREHICDEQMGKGSLKPKASLSVRQISSLFYLVSKVNILYVKLAWSATSVLLGE